MDSASAPGRTSGLSWLTSLSPSAIAFVVLGLPLCLGITYILSDYCRVLKQRQKLPPGPFPWPLVGNHYQIKLPRPWLYMTDLGKQYNSPMVTIWHGHKANIICNDIWSISDLLDKRATIYSSRPHMVMLGDSRNATNYDQVCLPYGDHWRYHRRLTHNATGSQAVRAYRPFQESEIKIMMRDLLVTPDKFVKAIERYSISIVSCIGFGRRVDKMDDDVAQVALKFMEGVDLVMPGMFIMETIPWLIKLPRWLYPTASKVLANGHKFNRFFTSLSREAADKFDVDNFAKTLFKEKEASRLRDEEISFLTGNMIGGGVDTTASTTITFLLAMCAFPDVQRKAQAEIDAVVGGRDGDASSRMPDWIDEAALPYIRACVDESLRWRTVTILGGIPHAPSQDDVYGDYHIPQGTWITGNLWAIHRDPKEFPEPDVFKPERFLDPDRPPFPTKKGHSAFGWGRRQCSGQPLAEQGLFLTFARLLWAFDIRPGLDADVSLGRPFQPHLSLSRSIRFSHPLLYLSQGEGEGEPEPELCNFPSTPPSPRPSNPLLSPVLALTQVFFPFSSGKRSASRHLRLRRVGEHETRAVPRTVRAPQRQTPRRHPRRGRRGARVSDSL